MIGEGCTIAAGARVKGPTVLGRGCEVGQEAVIEGSVLWDNAKVKEKAVLKNCIIGSGSCVEEGCYIIEGSVIGDEVTVPRGSKLPPDIKEGD